MRYFFFIFLIALAACSNVDVNEHPNESPLARVNDNYLYPSDLAKMGYVEDNDSVLPVEEIVQEWITRELMLNKAEEQINVGHDIDEKVADYRASLLLHEYHSALLTKNQIVVGDEELAAYYEEYKENFVLDETLFETKFVYLPGNIQELKSIKDALNEGNILNIVAEVCGNNPGNCSLEEPVWLDKNSLKEKMEIPASKLYASERYRDIKTENGDILVYQISEKRNKGDAKPLPLVKEIISQIVLNNKKKEMLSEIENKVYINAKNNKTVEIFN